MQQFIVTIEGHGFTDVEEIELPRLPADGDPLDTKYGTCIVVGGANRKRFQSAVQVDGIQ